MSHHAPLPLAPDAPLATVPRSVSPMHAFEELRQLGLATFAAGRIEESVAVLARALESAETTGVQRLVDLAACNLASAEISLGHPEPLSAASMARLREILMRNDDSANSFLAAYNLARAYEYKKEVRKGLFYARIALDRARLSERAEWIAAGHNQIGNFLLAQSFFDQAVTEYGEALFLLPETATERELLVQINLGYAALVLGDRPRAFELLYASLRRLNRLGLKRGQMIAHIDLCYAHLEATRYRDAVRNGLRGLALAQELGEVDSQKNALYLLGQACNLEGNEDAARTYFSHLQEQFYPQTRGIADFLLAVDVRKMINLRA